MVNDVIDNNQMTERLYEEIKLGMNRIKKDNPNDQILRIKCNESGNFTRCIGKNNTVMNWNLSYVNVEYLKELATDGIKVLPTFDYNKKLVNLLFVMNIGNINEIAEEQIIEETVNQVDNNQELKNEKIEELTEFFANENDKSSGILEKKPITILKSVKEFFEDLKQAFSELNLSFTKEVEEQIDAIDGEQVTEEPEIVQKLKQMKDDNIFRSDV